MNLFDVLDQAAQAKIKTTELEFQKSGVVFEFRDLNSDEMAAVMETLAELPVAQEAAEALDSTTAQVAASDTVTKKKINLKDVAKNFQAMALIANQVLEFHNLIVGWRGLTVEKLYEIAHRVPNIGENVLAEVIEYDPANAQRFVAMCATNNNSFKMFMAGSAVKTLNERQDEKKS